MFSLSGNAQPVNNGALSLGAPTGQQQVMPGAWPGQQPNAMQQMGNNAYMGGGMAGGQPQQWGQQQVAPPTEMEIQIMLLRGIVPLDRFIASPQMGTLVEMFSNLVTFSVLEIMKNSVFVADDEGNLKIDITQLPQHLQTMSGENVKAGFTALQGSAQQNIQQAEMQQQQIVAMAQQSMMGGALSAAMADEGFMQKVGSTTGNFARTFIGGR
tara:strand:- start:2697 stop:3332 length:636 start_codon:yes stop_codon:yes gene_type:complete